MKNIFKKKETDEEVVELTPDEKKARIKKIGIAILKTVGFVAAGAAAVLAVVAGVGHMTENSDKASDDVIEGTCEDSEEGKSEE